MGYQMPEIQCQFYDAPFAKEFSVFKFCACHVGGRESVKIFIDRE